MVEVAFLSSSISKAIVISHFDEIPPQTLLKNHLDLRPLVDYAMDCFAVCDGWLSTTWEASAASSWIYKRRFLSHAHL